MNYTRQWAQALLAFPNLVFLVLDTTGLGKDADILRVLVANKTGLPEYSTIISPGRHVGEANTFYTGVTSQDLATIAPPIHDVWNDIAEALKGKYVLSYSAGFVEERLDENAKAYGLPPITIIGDCLQQTAVGYFRSTYGLKLVDACARIGHTMPTPAMAYDRVQGQVALLNAMAQGITDMQEPDEDDHPF